MGKPADISKFNVKESQQPTPAVEVPPKPKVDRKKKGILISVAAAARFASLKEQVDKSGPELMEEALNLLFEKYGLEGIDY